MQEFQTGVTAEANSHALFLTLNQRRDEGAASVILRVLNAVPAMEQQYRELHPTADLHIVVAIGSEYWDILLGSPRPAELRAFPQLNNGELKAPATPVDLLFHIRSERHDLNFELGQTLLALLEGAVDLVEEKHGFRYLDSRDLTGFVDGTENPQDLHREEVAVVGDEDEAFAGGSYIHLQRYRHNLKKWNQQPLKVQEDVFGRTKVDNIEYPSDEKALTAHTKRTSIKQDGRSLEILRHSLPYGDMKESGLMFLSYCRTPENFERMLKSMFEGDEQGNTDHMLKYTEAVTGQAFFAPSKRWLRDL